MGEQPPVHTLGRYEIRGTLGSGAMALVLDGWDPMIGRRVAIKTIRRDQLDSAEAEEIVERFKREAQAAGRLNHPNIVSVYEYGEDQGIAFIAMEFISGRELKSYFEKNERFAIPDVVRIMTQLLGALEVAHRNGIVHRDIKPGNIYIVEGGNVKVTDFGIARVESSNLTQAGMVLGTPPYMSPEQFMGHPLDGRSDLFSAGAILYQFLTGERAFTGSQAGTIMHKVLEEDPPAPSKINVTLPPAFDAVLRKALAKRPDDRFATAREFIDALNAAAEGRVIADFVPPVAKAKPVASEAGDDERTMVTTRGEIAPAPKKSKSGLGIGIAVVALVVAGGVYWWANAPVKAPPELLLPPVPPPAPKPYDPVKALERIFDARDRDYAVSVVPTPASVKIGRDRLGFRISSGKPGYLYVLMVGTDKSFNLLFPNAVDAANQVVAGQAIELPRQGWAMTAAGPKGVDHFVAVVSENPRDFSSAGLKKVDPFGEFPVDVAAKLAAAAGDAPLFAGTPVCKAGGECSPRYGAAIFTVEETD